MIPREIEELFKKLEPIYSNRIKLLRMEYHLNPNSRAEIELLLARMLAKSFGDQTPVSLPPNQAVQGTYPLGEVVLGSRTWAQFGLNEDEWIRDQIRCFRQKCGKFSYPMPSIWHKIPFVIGLSFGQLQQTERG